MKSNILTLIILSACVATLATSCKDQEKESVCKEISPFASFEISWDDYNTVDEFRRYFDCHDSTILIHDYDTVRIKGYLVYLQGIGCFLRDSLIDTDTNSWLYVGSIWDVTIDTSKMSYGSYIFLNGYEPRLYPYFHKQCCDWGYTLKYNDNSLYYEK